MTHPLSKRQKRALTRDAQIRQGPSQTEPSGDEARLAALDAVNGISWVYISLAMFSVSLLSGATFNFGIQLSDDRDGAGTLLSMFRVLPISLVLILMIYTGWSYILKAIPLLNTARGIIGFVFAIGWTCWCILVSAYFSFLAMAAPALIAANLYATQMAVSRAGDATTELSSRAEARTGLLKGLVAKAKSLERAELDGRISGRPGAGDVSGMYGSVAAGLSAVITDIEGSAEAARLSAGKLAPALAAVDRVIDTKGDILEREDRFKVAMAPVFEILREIRAAGLEEKIRNAVILLRSSAAPVSFGDEAYAQRQAAIMAAYQAELSAAADQLEALLTRPDEAAERVPERIARVELTELVWLHGHRQLPFALIAVGLDVFGLAMLSFLIIASERRSVSPAASAPALPTRRRWRLWRRKKPLLRNPFRS